MRSVDVLKFFEVYTGGNNHVSTWTPEAIMEFAEAFHKMKTGTEIEFLDYIIIKSDNKFFNYQFYHKNFEGDTDKRHGIGNTIQDCKDQITCISVECVGTGDCVWTLRCNSKICLIK